ncbi:uncharacterized protein LOC123018233, partial [Varanus komodoensis]|uniref:uncharacterized protein LOC123018233 n=1 Tax=Varanus komodoensis TaxID=61221 RepID=UPI001CF76F70
EHIMRKAELDESPVGIKIAGRSNNFRYADDTTLMAESEEELKSLLMQVKEESAKVGLKLNIKKTKIMASGPLTSWQIDGEEMEVVTDFIFLGSKITADGDCSQEIKRCLLLGRKAMANLDSILKSRDIILPTKVCIVKAMFFPVAMYGCESWTIRKSPTSPVSHGHKWPQMAAPPFGCRPSAAGQRPLAPGRVWRVKPAPARTPRPNPASFLLAPAGGSREVRGNLSSSKMAVPSSVPSAAGLAWPWCPPCPGGPAMAVGAVSAGPRLGGVPQSGGSDSDSVAQQVV